MFLFVRRLSSGPAPSKQVLQSLRSETGLPFIKIKEALTANDNDPALAREWLLAQAAQHNWTKAQQLKDRKTSEGLVGVLSGNGRVAMAALTCETDFVSRNSKFLDLLHTSLVAVAESEDRCRSVTDALALPTQEGRLGDLISGAVGSLGENIRLRGVYSAPDSPSVTTYLHRRTDSAIAGLQLGSIGVMLTCDSETHPESAKLIAQHIAGSDKLGDLGSQPLLQDEAVTVGELCKTHGFKILDFCKVQKDSAPQWLRVHNLIVFGLEEEIGENLDAKIYDVLSTVSENPSYQSVVRLGRFSDEQKGPRPVKVGFYSEGAASHILEHKRRLGEKECYKKVFLSPDRTPEERQKRRDMLTQLTKEKYKNEWKYKDQVYVD